LWEQNPYNPTAELTHLHRKDRTMTEAAIAFGLFGTVILYRRLEGHPFLRTWLVFGFLATIVAVTGYVLGHDDPENPITLPGALFAAAYFSFVLSAVFRGLVRFFGWDLDTSWRPSDTSTIGWYSGPNNPGPGRFDPPGGPRY
jgi:hypothetical protein